MIPRRAPLAGLIVGLAIGAWANLAARAGQAGSAQLPAALPDEELWQLSQQFSEPNGFFPSDNLVSDEPLYRDVVPTIANDGRRNGVYLGVGPEQNFTYIAALEPRIAFIVDIRRGNLHLQLMYKALFELSADRAEFVSRLFTKSRPAGLGAASSARDIIAGFWQVRTDPPAAYQANVDAIRQLLVDKHRLPLTDDDWKGIEYVYYKFYWHGPAITWGSSSGNPMRMPTFGDLMRQTDANGRELSFLASESAFKVVKDLQAKNLIVPVVGDFAGTKALRAIGDYVRSRNAVITAFYVSEVEPYLAEQKRLPAFCANLATLPIAGSSVLIRPPTALTMTLGPATTLPPASSSPVMPAIASEVKSCAARSGVQVQAGRSDS